MGERIIFDPSTSDNKDVQQSASVVSLADVRISRGWSKPGKACAHKSLVYSAQDRRTECADCDQPVDAFDAFMVLALHFEAMERAARSRDHKARQSLAATLVRRSAKAIDKAWGNKMAPCCPHCRGGLLPDDFEHGGSQIGQEFERARRQRQAAAPTTKETGT